MVGLFAIGSTLGEVLVELAIELMLLSRDSCVSGFDTRVAAFVSISSIEDRLAYEAFLELAWV